MNNTDTDTDVFVDLSKAVLHSLDHPAVSLDVQRSQVVAPEKDIEEEVKRFLSARFRAVERDDVFLRAVKEKLLEKLDDMSPNQLLAVLTKVQALSATTVDALLKPFTARDKSPLLESSRSESSTDEELNRKASPDVLKALAELNRFLEVLHRRGIELQTSPGGVKSAEQSRPPETPTAPPEG